MIRRLTLLTVIVLSGCATIHFDNGDHTQGDIIPPPNDPPSALMRWLMFWEEEPEIPFDADLQAVRRDQWHHHLFFQVMELSPPLQLEDVCPGQDWNRVTTKITLGNVFVGLLDNALLYRSSSSGLDLWTPWTIEYSCGY